MLYAKGSTVAAATADNESLITDMRAIDNNEACHWIHDRKCPDPDVRFFLFTQANSRNDEGQLIHVDVSLEASNLSSSFFRPQLSSKIIIHGFRSDMFLTPLMKMKTGE